MDTNCLLQKGKKWSTNAASKNLGLSILLDPMTHDNIKGEKALEVIDNTQTHLTSRNTFTMDWFGNFAVADNDRGKNAADSSFYSGWKVANS